MCLAVVASACEPSIPFTPPAPVVSAVFDPLHSKIPLPNDLAFLNPPNTVCPPGSTPPAGTTAACAQAELLTHLAGAFPSDQEVAVTIDFQQTNFDASGNMTFVAPDLDLTTFTPSTFFVFGATATDRGEVTLDPLVAADYVKLADHGTLSLHHQGRAPWAPGTYAVFVRGGDSGVHTTDHIAISPSAIFDLVAQGLDLTDPRNLGLLKAQAGTTAAALAQGMQLNLLIDLYKASAFPIADTRFPHQELAILTTFRIGPTVTNVTIDPARGLVPLPIDLLRDPVAGTLTPLAACTLAGSTLSADGTCPSPAAAGFQTLDGFSTTGSILAPTSDLVEAATITPSSLLLYELSKTAAPKQVDPTGLIIEPCELTSSCSAPQTALSPVIAIQPAGATSGDPSSIFRTHPLKDGTDYAVVMTTAIHDKAGQSIGAGTVAQIVGFFNPLTIGGHSALQGIDDGTAASLEAMRGELGPVFTALATKGIARDQVAMAYTFHTQSLLGVATQLAAGAYTAPAITASPTLQSVDPPLAAFNKFGVDTAVVPGSAPTDNIAEILEVTLFAFDLIDPASGAFLADPTKAAPEIIPALIAVPKTSNPNVPACTGGLAPFGKCAPMVIFRHGLGRGRADMLAVADTFAAAGMVTVAIDAAKHGDRSFCTSGTTGAASGCVGGAACTTNLPAGAQGDAHPPGTCGNAGFIKRPVSPTCTGACASDATDGIPVVSGNYLVTANFFRTRDTMRQDVIDQSQLVRVLAFAPSTGLPTGNQVFDHMAPNGLIIDPATVYFVGQSLGSIQGAMDVAANPRISKAVFNVGGGSVVDVFTNSPAFQDQVNQLLAGLGIQRGTSGFLQFLAVAKTVLDPADPINFVGHLTANTLPDFVANAKNPPASAPKKILTQIANCDGVVPNPFELIFASNVATGPLPGLPGFSATSTGTFQIFISDPAHFSFGSCPAAAVEHGFLTDWVTHNITLQAQTDAANFLMHDTAPLSIQHP